MNFYTVCGAEQHWCGGSIRYLLCLASIQCVAILTGGYICIVGQGLGLAHLLLDRKIFLGKSSNNWNAVLNVFSCVPRISELIMVI